MKINREEINEIVRRVLTYYIRKKSSGERKKTLYMIPAFPVGLEEVLAEYELYGESEDMDFILEENFADAALHGKAVFYKEEPADMRHIFRLLTTYKRLEIHTPSIDFLRSVKDGREEDSFVRIALYFLMMHKSVIIREPYRQEELPEGRFAREVKEMQSDLWDMGATFTGLGVSVGDVEAVKQELADSLITENTVTDAYEKGRREILTAENAVITPLALEKAKILGLRIVQR